MPWWGWILSIVGVIAVTLEILRLARNERLDREATAIALHQAKLRWHGWTPWRWSQDGWVRFCKRCDVVHYGGDDYDGGPSDAGPIL